MKELIAIIQDIPVAHQSLIFCNSTLDDRQSLGAAGVADGDTLTLVLADNAVISACASCGKWEQATRLLKAMAKDGVPPRCPQTGEEIAYVAPNRVVESILSRYLS